MTEVSISKVDGRWRVVIGGVDLTRAIAAGDLAIEVPPEPDLPLVHVTFRAREFNLNLDEAVIKATENLLALNEDVPQ
jgi:hypothetical protein